MIKRKILRHRPNSWCQIKCMRKKENKITQDPIITPNHRRDHIKHIISESRSEDGLSEQWPTFLLTLSNQTKIRIQVPVFS